MVAKHFICVYFIMLLPFFPILYTIFVVSNEILKNVKNSLIPIRVLKSRLMHIFKEKTSIFQVIKRRFVLLYHLHCFKLFWQFLPLRVKILKNFNIRKKHIVKSIILFTFYYVEKILSCVSFPGLFHCFALFLMIDDKKMKYFKSFENS